MGINITTQELLEILDLTPPEQNIMLVGRHGIGKSEILTQYFSEHGMRVVPLFLGQMSDPGDLIGLPAKSNGHEGFDHEAQTTFLPPYWFPVDDRPIVLFLDELNRARPEVLQTIMDLALNRTLAGRRLPEGSRIISAVNAGDEYQLTDLDPALVSRFNVYNFLPTVSEWLLWADRNKLDSRIINFIQEESSWLDGNEGQKKGIDTGLEKSPDRRAWKRVSDLIVGREDLTEIHRKLIAGIIGVAATSKFFGSISGNKILTGIEVLLSFDKHLPTLGKYRLHQLAIVNDSIFRFLETGEILDSQCDEIGKNLVRYVSFLEKSNNKEALAHLASRFEQTDYQRAVLFVLDHASEVYDKVMAFISNL